MATVTKLHVSPQSMDYMNFKHYYRTGQPPVRPGFGRSQPMLDAINVLGKLKLCRGVCRSFRGEDGGRELGEKQLEEARKCGNLKENQVEYSPEKGNGFLSNLKSSILKVSRSNSKDEYRNAVAKLEEIFSSIAVQIGRYIVTMMSTGVILAVGFQLSGGDSQLNTLIWYSWLGGIIIGTMIGANMVLDEHCRAGPRNVVITGSTRGLGKALAREFLLSGDHVVVASRSPESVHMTVKELEENLKEGMISASGASRKNLAHAKVVGIACDVCEPDDVRKLANFAVNELGSIDIWAFVLCRVSALPVCLFGSFVLCPFGAPCDSTKKLHLLLQQNRPTVSGQQYSSSRTGQQEEIRPPDAYHSIFRPATSPDLFA